MPLRAAPRALCLHQDLALPPPPVARGLCSSFYILSLIYITYLVSRGAWTHTHTPSSVPPAHPSVTSDI